jgi:hypothetical protein
MNDVEEKYVYTLLVKKNIEGRNHFGELEIYRRVIIQLMVEQ